MKHKPLVFSHMQMFGTGAFVAHMHCYLSVGSLHLHEVEARPATALPFSGSSFSFSHRCV